MLRVTRYMLKKFRMLWSVSVGAVVMNASDPCSIPLKVACHNVLHCRGSCDLFRPAAGHIATVMKGEFGIAYDRKNIYFKMLNQIKSLLLARPIEQVKNAFRYDLTFLCIGTTGPDCTNRGVPRASLRTASRWSAPIASLSEFFCFALAKYFFLPRQGLRTCLIQTWKLEVLGLSLISNQPNIHQPS